MPPRIRDRAAFEDDVIDRVLGQEVAGSETGVAGADDDCRGSFDGAGLTRPRR
jgi:hypothetical protein